MGYVATTRVPRPDVVQIPWAAQVVDAEARRWHPASTMQGSAFRMPPRRLRWDIEPYVIAWIQAVTDGVVSVQSAVWNQPIDGRTAARRWPSPVADRDMGWTTAALTPVLDPIDAVAAVESWARAERMKPSRPDLSAYQQAARARGVLLLTVEDVAAAWDRDREATPRRRAMRRAPMVVEYAVPPTFDPATIAAVESWARVTRTRRRIWRVEADGRVVSLEPPAAPAFDPMDAVAAVEAFGRMTRTRRRVTRVEAVGTRDVVDVPFDVAGSAAWVFQGSAFRTRARARVDVRRVGQPGSEWIREVLSGLPVPPVVVKMEGVTVYVATLGGLDVEV